MVLKRMRQVIRAERKWLGIIKNELTIFPKKQYFRAWKVDLGMAKLQKKRKF